MGCWKNGGIWRVLACSCVFCCHGIELRTLSNHSNMLENEVLLDIKGEHSTLSDGKLAYNSRTIVIGPESMRGRAPEIAELVRETLSELRSDAVRVPPPIRGVVVRLPEEGSTVGQWRVTVINERHFSIESSGSPHYWRGCVATGFGPSDWREYQCGEHWTTLAFFPNGDAEGKSLDTGFKFI